MIPFLRPSDPFPPLASACDDLGGLLAIGADLSPERLLEAYRQGIFPWGRHENFPLWYTPDPRMVLIPEQIHISRSLRRVLRRQVFEVRLDTAFDAVIRACAETPRPGQDGTWIDTAMQEAYTRLHELGWAHSVECYAQGDLVGGLYGLAIGKMFYGESMFSRRADASKVAFAHLARFLSNHGFGMIDCQMRTTHLASLGAREVPGRVFYGKVGELVVANGESGRWPVRGAQTDWIESWPS